MYEGPFKWTGAVVTFALALARTHAPALVCSEYSHCVPFCELSSPTLSTGAGQQQITHIDESADITRYNQITSACLKLISNFLVPGCVMVGKRARFLMLLLECTLVLYRLGDSTMLDGPNVDQVDSTDDFLTDATLRGHHTHHILFLCQNYTLLWGEMAQWLESELINRKVCGSDLTSASRLLLSRLGQPDSILALLLPSDCIAARHRKGATAERFFYTLLSILSSSN
ncbi:hypothetical protein T265_07083 [Opisthorchis viverrini]|uniref:Uncharacterized protein n=1 Tax=Opisthorchis viverrini TaxID=6198 RepID=A0A075ACI4_OPIVI|nr:hypothetical protein T265_07083 [Opisthorchis viverrini]KER25459.1 hypothetical protein T265_07083 [Opisthorchis viverrini]